MTVLSRALPLLLATGVLGFADVTITATNPNFPGASSNGVGVFGSFATYGFQDFTLSNVGTAWTLTIDTNYGTNINGISGAMPGFCDNAGPPYPATNFFPDCLSHGSQPFFMADFLIQEGSNHYGIVLSSHSPLASDSYVAGNLYSATGFVNAASFGKGPVILSTEISKLNTDIGGGKESAISNPLACNDGTGVKCAEYRITDKFTADANFFDPNGDFTIYASSADCDNEGIIYHHAVPEPGGLIYMVPVLLLVGSYLRRRSLARVK